MDRTAWRTTIHGVAKELDMTEPLNKKNNTEPRASHIFSLISHSEISEYHVLPLQMRKLRPNEH